MGIMIGTQNPNMKRIVIKGGDGVAAGTIMSTRPSGKKPKRLWYNFKEISTLLLRTGTASGARKVVLKAAGRVSMLRRKLKSEEYDSKEVENALSHALKMERVARKKMKHLLQEEKAKRQGGDRLGGTVEAEEAQEADRDFGEENERKLKEEKLTRLIREYEKCMREMAQKTVEMQNGEELTDEMMEAVPSDMSPEDLELLKKKRRAKEMKEIMEADLQYLKAEFDRLSKEKQEAVSGGSFGGCSFGSDGAVSLELANMEVPVQTVEAPVAGEGGSVDVTV